MTVSGMDVPAGMKNPTSGDFSVMLNSCIAEDDFWIDHNGIKRWVRCRLGIYALGYIPRGFVLYSKRKSLVEEGDFRIPDRGRLL